MSPESDNLGSLVSERNPPYPAVSCETCRYTWYIHATTITKLLGPGGTRAEVADSLLMKQQLCVINRSRRRAVDRCLFGCWSLFLNPRRIRRAALIIRQSTPLKMPIPTLAGESAHSGDQDRSVRTLIAPLSRAIDRNPASRIPGLCVLLEYQ